jgi:hypothetical protein
MVPMTSLVGVVVFDDKEILGTRLHLKWSDAGPQRVRFLLLAVALAALDVRDDACEVAAPGHLQFTMLPLCNGESHTVEAGVGVVARVVTGVGRGDGGATNKSQWRKRGIKIVMLCVRR